MRKTKYVVTKSLLSAGKISIFCKKINSLTHHTGSLENRTSSYIDETRESFNICVS